MAAPLYASAVVIPLLFVISTAHGLHDSIAIAAGDKGALVTWDEQATIGGQRSVAAAVVNEYGYSSIPRLIDGGGEPDQISAVWTGEAWTVAICNDAWGPDNRERMLVWGEVSTDGTFTRQGEEHFGPTSGALHCSNLQVAGGVPYLYVATHDEHCAARRVELGPAARFGPVRPLCNVWGGIGDVLFGIDEHDRPAMYARGELHRTAVTEEVVFGSDFLVTREQATLRFWKAPFTSPVRTQRLPAKPIDPFDHARVTTGGEATLLTQFQMDERLTQRKKDVLVAAVFDKTGLVWSDSFTAEGAGSMACALVGEAVFCAWWVDSDVHVWNLRR